MSGAIGTLEGLAVSTVFLLVLFIGFCLLFNIPKLRASGRHSKVVRGLDELVGVPQHYLHADAPAGTVDQLRTPELLEAVRRKSA
ncbi:MAG TPA: hypothetical protein VK595_17480 [Vicinamibacterales bacterium]|nr:hypothetical protein [Vicinamibacterales bacterium]